MTDRAGPSTAALRRVGLVMGAWVVGMWGIVGVFVARAIPGGWWSIAAAMTLSLVPIVVLLRGFGRRAYPSGWTRVLVLRPLWYVLLLLPLVAVSGLVGSLVGWLLGDALVGGRWAVVVVALTLALFVLAGYAGSRRLVVKPLEVSFADLPAGLDGLRIVQLSDLHVGPHTPRGHVARIVRAIERAAPDILVHTGDQVDDHDQDVAHFVRAFGHVRAPLGVYAIAGNHDIYAGWEGVRAGLEGAGIRVLVNDAVPVARGEHTFWVAGTGDPAARQWGASHPGLPAPDLDRTMEKVPAGAFSLVLAHNPALWPGLAQRGARLTLSGHTHHGQLSIPALNWCLASPFLEHAMGQHWKGDSTLYINPGTNYWGLPLRLGAWPEVTVVTLRKSI